MDAAQKSGVDRENELTKREQLISTLPAVSLGILEESLYNYKDFWFFSSHLEGIVSSQHRFVAQPEDVILCSTPKAGTTWLKALAFATMTRAQFGVDSSAHPLRTSTPHECVPFLDYELEKVLNDRKRFRILTMHAPYGLLPESVRSSGCKIVYVWRDPKDVFVSFLHFSYGVKYGTGLDAHSVSLDEAFDQFCRGISICGPYWDHVLGFLRASKEQPDKVLCLRYEELIDDTSDGIKRLAEFISQPFSPDEEERGVVEKIVKLCSFENLRSSEANRKGEFRSENGRLVVPNTLFYRIGQVGDWRNYLSDEMAARLDRIFQEKIENLDYGFKIG